MNENRKPIVTFIFVGLTVLMYGFYSISDETFVKLFVLKSSELSSLLPWQFITYAFYSPQRIIFFFFKVIILLMFGMGLERVWGSLHFGIFIGVSILAKSILAFLIGPLPIFGDWPIYLSIMVAFGFNYPHHQIRLFFIIPIRIKILAIVFLVLVFIQLIYSLFIKINMLPGLLPVSLRLSNFLVTLASYTGLFIYAPKIFDFSHIRRMLHHTENKLKEIKVNTEKEVVKSDNSKLLLLLDKIEKKESLTDSERTFIEADDCDPELLCQSNDFDRNDEYCLTCEKYIECIRRAIKEHISD